MLIPSRVKMETVNKDLKRCSTSLIARKMQIRATIRYLIIAVRVGIIGKLRTINVGVDVEKRNPPILFARMKADTATMENSMEISFKTGNKTTTCCAVLSCSAVSVSLQPHGL